MNHTEAKTAKVEQILVEDQRTPWLNVHRAYDEMPLTIEAFRVLAHLSRRADNDSGEACPSYATIGVCCFQASYPNSSPETLRRKAIKAVKELEGFGLIRKTPRYKEVRGEMVCQANVYILTHSSEWTFNFNPSPNNSNQRSCKGSRDWGSDSPALPGQNQEEPGKVPNSCDPDRMGSVGVPLPSGSGTPCSAGGTLKGNPSQGNPSQGNPGLEQNGQLALVKPDNVVDIAPDTPAKKGKPGALDPVRWQECYNRNKPDKWTGSRTLPESTIEGFKRAIKICGGDQEKALEMFAVGLQHIRIGKDSYWRDWDGGNIETPFLKSKIGQRFVAWADAGYDVNLNPQAVAASGMSEADIARARKMQLLEQIGGVKKYA